MQARVASEPPSNGWRRIRQSAVDGSIALALLAAFENVLVPGRADLAPVALGGVFGATLGAAIGAGHAALASWPRRSRRLAWCGAGALLGAWPAVAIGAIAKLHGPHHVMAAGTLAAGVLGGAALGAYLSLPDADGSRHSRAAGGRWVLASTALSCVAAIGAEIADETLLVLRSYPPVRAALVVVAALLAVQAGIASGTFLRLRRPAPRGSTLLSIAWVVALSAGTVVDARLSGDRVAPLLFRPVSGALFRLARAVTDFDRDGASSWFGGGDCAPFDGKVSPSARESPGNGIDDNCRWGDARPRRLNAGPVRMPDGPPEVDVLVVTIDALRADHLGVYGYGRPTSPRLTEFARTARTFTHAYTSGGWTCLALQSMLSGLYPRRLDWGPAAFTDRDRLLPYPFEAKLEAGEHWTINASAPVRTPDATLPRWLSRRGVHTAAVLSSVPGIILRYNGFLESNFERRVVLPDGDDARVVDAALDVLRELGDAPSFLWVHLYEPHEPYAAHPGLPVFGDGLEDRYDHDIAFMDRQLGRLLDGVDGRRTRPTAVIVAADHGESFAGGFPVHGVDLGEDTVRIPLLVRGPGVSPGTSDVPASLVDVAPTVFEWTGTPPPADLDGVSLLRAPRERVLLSDIWRHDRSGRVYIDLVAATGARTRLVHDRMTNTSFMYRVGDESRPPKPLDEPLDPALEAAIGRYLEASGTLE
jgi:hypothetical protein